MPAYCTGLGKAVLAFLPAKEFEDYLRSVKLVPMSPKSITDPQTLRAEIERVRKRGYAVDNQELSLGLRCVGVPIFDYTGRPTYAMSVSAPVSRMSAEKIKAIQTKLRSLCRQISRQIGAPDA